MQYMAIQMHQNLQKG